MLNRTHIPEGTRRWRLELVGAAPPTRLTCSSTGFISPRNERQVTDGFRTWALTPELCYLITEDPVPTQQLILRDEPPLVGYAIP